MGTGRTIQTDFKSGEIDPLLKMRVDTAAVQSGCERLRNCVIYTSGAVSRRPGTKYVKAFTPTDPGEACAMFPFEFSATERYIIILFDARLDLVRVTETGTQYIGFFPSTACPWTAATVREITFAQVADTMIICHKSFQPRVLKRLSLTSFNLSVYDFTSTYDSTNKNQPYYKFSTSIRMRCSSFLKGATATLTASAAYFQAAHVGTVFRIFGCEMEVRAFIDATNVTVFVRRDLRKRLDPNPVKTSNASGVLEVLAIGHGMSTGSIVNIKGFNAIMGYASGSTALSQILPEANVNKNHTITALDQDRFTIPNLVGVATTPTNVTASYDGGGVNVEMATTDFTLDWDEQAFSNVRGWPGAVCFHENRLWFAGTPSIPDGVFASRSGLYYDFNVGIGGDSDSIQFTVGSSKIATIRHIVSNRVLQLFSDLAEYVVNPGISGPVTPGNVVVRQQTPYGTANVFPIPFDGSTIFIQSNNQTVREFVYAQGEDGFVATDLTAAASHLVDNPISMCVITGTKGRTEQYALLVNQAGTIAVFHSSKAEGLAAWTQWSTVAGHQFRSVVAVGNRVFTMVRRQHTTTADTVTPVYTMVLEEFAFDDYSITLDCTREYTATPAQGLIQSWSSAFLIGLTDPRIANEQLNFYHGNTVAFTSSGVVSGTATNIYLGQVSGVNLYALPAFGVNIGVPRGNLRWGFGWSIEIKTLPPNMEMPDGAMAGIRRRINRVIIGIDSTLSMAVEGQSFVARQITENLAEDPVPQSTKQQFYMLGYDRDPCVRIAQDAPLPIRITGIVTEVSV